MVVSDDGGNIFAIDVQRFSVIQTIKAHKGQAFVVEYFDADKKKVASIGNDGILKKWRKVDGNYILDKEVKAHNSPCCTLFYNDDGTKLLTGGQDGWLKIWDAKSMQLIMGLNTNADTL